MSFQTVPESQHRSTPLRTYSHLTLCVYFTTVLGNHFSGQRTGRWWPTDRSAYRCADKSLAPTISRCILFDGENISFDASLVICLNSTNIPPIMIINGIYEHQNLLSLWLVSFLVRLRTYQHPSIFPILLCVIIFVWLCHRGNLPVKTKNTW